MKANEPAALLKGKYAGPGVADWMVALSATVFAALDLQNRIGDEGVQTVARYYFRVAGISLLQGIGVWVDVVVVAACAGWMAWPHRRRWFEPVICAACAVGVLAVWAELVKAVSTQPNSVFVLDGLPFRPLANFGILGSTVFLLYLLSKHRFSDSFRLDLVLKGLCAAAASGVQLLGYTALAHQSRV